MKYYAYEIRKTSTHDLVMSYDNLHDLRLFLTVNQASLNDTTLNIIKFCLSQKGKYARKLIDHIVFSNNETTESINDLISRLE